MPVDSLNTSSRALLDAAYKELEFDQGALLPASKRPPGEMDLGWVEKGDWQSLAKDVGAEKIFFVDREPVAVFAEFKTTNDAEFREAYNKIWCMARPQLLFLARRGELGVYDLTKPPIKSGERPEGQNRLLDSVQTLAEVQKRLQKYHRELIETGVVFGEERFRQGLDRADRALIRNLKEVLRELKKLDLRTGSSLTEPRKLQLLHSLIGRTIFVRYLEDRKIITRDYFIKVVELSDANAEQKRDWRKIIDQPLKHENLTEQLSELIFPRILGDKVFTYALFKQLDHDFNGDTFPVEDDERRCLLQHHLSALRDFFLGLKVGEQSLFFYAYKFDVIPIELISSIYEEFYTERVGDEKNQGSHYTPPALVEFVLANTLTREILETKPRVLDPACGSGIFLVEAFRRMVRHLCATQSKQRPSREELRAILRDQISGMDINEEAVRVAAFSLYLAFLHYQDPHQILPDPREDLRRKPGTLKAVRLPHLQWMSAEKKQEREREKTGVEFFDTLLVASAFDPVMGKCAPDVNQRFGPNCADVIVGNPPWGDPDPQTEREKQAVANLKEWCDPAQNRPLGDNERSQAFIHLTLSLLKKGKRAGLLVSSGVFFKHHDNSKAFRRVWLNAVQLQQVVNFAHVRKVFFSGSERETKGVSPFVSVVFDNVPLSAAAHKRFEYWSPKRTAVVENTKTVVMTRGDMHYLNQTDCVAYEKLWKIYWWGRHRDEVLLRSFNRFTSLSNLPSSISGGKLIPGQGFKKANQANPAEWLSDYQELPAHALRRYGPLDKSMFRPTPARVERRGVEAVFKGRRLLIGRGIKDGGFINARFETKKYAFRNSIHGIRLEGFQPWHEAVITGVFWSSIARYFYFSAAGSWGPWHDEIHLENVLEMPICFPDNRELRDRIVNIVYELQKLRSSNSSGLERKPKASTTRQMELEMEKSQHLTTEPSIHRRDELERQLDEAMFDLYELNSAERDLVKDMCSGGLDLFYHHHESDAVKAVIEPESRFGTLAQIAKDESGLAAYLSIFLKWWNQELAPEGELAWRVLSPPSGAPLLAVLFETRYRSDANEPFEKEPNEAWQEVLEKLDKHARVPLGSLNVFSDTFYRVVTEHEILIVKRNERRFWTKSAAHEDAEATTLKAMVQQEKQKAR